MLMLQLLPAGGLVLSLLAMKTHHNQGIESHSLISFQYTLCYKNKMQGTTVCHVHVCTVNI